MNRTIFRSIAIISYLTSKIHEEYSTKQVGKTVIQKMIYLLKVKEKIVDFNYSMYHYGPYSSEVDGEIDFADDIGALNVEWKPEKGYYITTKEEILKHFLSFLTKEEKSSIDKLVKDYGKYSATELSIIATACYIKENKKNFRMSNEQDIIEGVHSLKPEYDKEYIEKILRKSGCISEQDLVLI